MLRKSIGLCHLAQCLPLTRAPQGMLFSSTPLCLVGFPGTITLWRRRGGSNSCGLNVSKVMSRLSSDNQSVTTQMINKRTSLE